VGSPRALVPFQVTPAGDLTDLVSAAELRTALIRTIPRWDSFKYGRGLHALRLWGPDAQFDTDRFPSPIRDAHTYSGAELRDLFLDHASLEHMIPYAEPILRDTPHGIGVMVLSSRSGFEGHVGHVDCLLRVCAEIGLPTTTRVATATHVGSIADMVAESEARFDSEQECEWSLEALARYLAPRNYIVNRFGERFTLSFIVDRLLKRPMGQGACYGTHVPYALMCVLQIDGRVRVLDTATRDRITRYFEVAVESIERCQNQNGSWPSRWAAGVEPDPLEEDLLVWQQEEARSMFTTAHHLEWIAIAPSALRPTRASIKKAIDYMLREVNRLPYHIIMYNYLSISHGVRALCLFKNANPMDLLSTTGLQRVGGGQTNQNDRPL
jgi:hypothetical protein